MTSTHPQNMGTSDPSGTGGGPSLDDEIRLTDDGIRFLLREFLARAGALGHEACSNSDSDSNISSGIETAGESGAANSESV